MPIENERQPKRLLWIWISFFLSINVLSFKKSVSMRMKPFKLFQSSEDLWFVHPTIRLRLFRCRNGFL
ncbi:hypothetical protein BSM4216_2345 [Bacillus smithii]|nr:hypothetical protein BSM4216_2345 [Bacillus smithii]